MQIGNVVLARFVGGSEFNAGSSESVAAGRLRDSGFGICSLLSAINFSNTDTTTSKSGRIVGSAFQHFYY